ncbi:MAG: peptide deformylase [Deltaproteobacteria bacterium]|nr:peptide deformylase [Deltaproteobacteria bacterium]
MAKLTVLTFPHPTLKQKAKSVHTFDAELATLAKNMLETMYASDGIGLAAVQVGQLKRLVVMDVSPAETGEEPVSTSKGAKNKTPRVKDPKVFVNPVLLKGEGEVVTEEGCLSVTDFTAEVKRFERIEVEYQTLKGQTLRETLTGTASVCLQHEMDHLEGKLFIDRLPPVKRQLVKKRLARLAQGA